MTNNSGKVRKRKPVAGLKETIDPEVWKVAYKAARRNPRRIQRVSRTEVLILNRPVR